MNFTDALAVPIEHKASFHALYIMFEQDNRSADIQSNLNGSNIFETMEICSRCGYFEPLRVNQSARLGDKWE